MESLWTWEITKWSNSDMAKAKIYVSVMSVLVCLVFWPNFRGCAHLNTCRYTFFGGFQPVWIILDIYQCFFVQQQDKHLKKKIFFYNIWKIRFSGFRMKNHQKHLKSTKRLKVLKKYFDQQLKTIEKKIILLKTVQKSISTNF